MNPPPSSPRAASRTRLLAGAALLVAAAGFALVTAGGIGENLVYYWGPSELHAAGHKAIGATIRLGGQVATGSVVQGQGSRLEFDVVDEEKRRVRVHTTSVPPQMFREGIGVVVEGTMTREGHFESQRLLVSHGNEYRAPGEGEAVDAEKAIRSTQGLTGAEGKAAP